MMFEEALILGFADGRIGNEFHRRIVDFGRVSIADFSHFTKRIPSDSRDFQLM